MNDFNYSKKFSNWLEIKKWKLFDYQKEFSAVLVKININNILFHQILVQVKQ